MEGFSRRRHQRNRCMWIRGVRGTRIAQTAAKQRLDRFKQRLRLQHHALSAAERPVVHGAVTVFCKFPQILNMYVNDPRLSSHADKPVIESPVEDLADV